MYYTYVYQKQWRVGDNMDLQSSLEVVSKSLEVVSKIQEIVSKTDVRVVVGIISFIGVILTAFITARNVNKTNKIAKSLGEKNLNALEQRRYIDAISTERVKWINNLRDNFSNFLKNVNLQMGDIYKIENEKQKNNEDSKIESKKQKDNEDSKIESEKQKDNEDKMRERLGEIMYIGNHIYLLLNPTEPICKKIRKLQIQIFKSLESYNGSGFDGENVQEVVDELSFYYQVVLKAEWKRVKEENTNGKEINQERMDSIYKETSENIDIEVYDNLYTNAES